MHLQTAIAELLSSLPSLKEVMVFSTGFLEVVSLLYVFLICKALTDTRMALTATLLLGVSDSHINWGTMLIPMSLGLAFFPLVVYFALKSKRTVREYGVLLSLLIVSILTHTVASFIILAVSGRCHPVLAVNLWLFAYGPACAPNTGAGLRSSPRLSDEGLCIVRHGCR